jgi:hypothetical protein
MNMKLSKISLIFLGITAFVFSRMLFVFFNDHDGPNPVVITAAAAAIFLPSLAAFLFDFSNIKKFAAAFLIQVLIASMLYFCLR